MMNRNFSPERAAHLSRTARPSALLFLVVVSVVTSPVREALLQAEPALLSLPDQPAIVLCLEDMGLNSAGSMAVSPNGRRVYVGAEHSSDHKRLNLAVVSLDQQGRRAGGPRHYRDSAMALPDKTGITISSLLVHPSGRKLYFGDNYGLPGSPMAPEITKTLSVYDLDAAGEPTGKPRGYDSGNPARQIQALALHPRRNRLYMSGWGSPGVHVYELDAAGEPQGQPKTYPLNGGFSLAVSEDGARLYLGTYPGTLRVVNLDAAGDPTGDPRSFTAGGPQDYLQFVYTPRALYLKRSTEQAISLAVWPLAKNGDPVGEPKAYDNLSARALAVDPSARTVRLGKDLTFTDAFTGKAIVEGTAPVAFEAGQDIGGAGRQGERKFRHGAVAMAVGAGGRAVLLTKPLPGGFLGHRTKGYRMRVTVLDARLRSGATPATVPVTAYFGHENPKEAKFGEVAPGRSSAWVDLDPYLRDQTALPRGWPTPVWVLAQPGHVPWSADSSVGLLKLRIEVAQEENVLKTLEEAVTGSQMVMMIPHYGFEPVERVSDEAEYGFETPEQRRQRIEMLSTYVDRYLKEARRCGLRPEERPKLFVINSNDVRGNQAHLGQLKKEAETLALLGFNTATPFRWEGVPLEQIDAVFDSFGLKRRSQATYNPPSYFAYDQEKMNAAALQKWATEQTKFQAEANGGKPDDVAEFMLSDEPGWYYPSMLAEVRRNPQWLEAFRTYLKGKGLQPADLGQADWGEIYPTGASQAVLPEAPVTTRRLYYWTMRFYPESASEGHRLARLALEDAFGRPMFAAANWNNFFSRWYVASPNAKFANNPDATRDAGGGGFDWMESGRRGAHALWTEDWFGDQEAQQWSFHADMLRSASMLGDQPFGGYVIGAYTGGLRDAGTTYKMLSLIGHGAKAVTVWTFGPAPVNGGNGWSENFSAYRSIADAMRIVGKSERLLYPGRPPRGNVAVFLPSTSSLWDNDHHLPHYHHEIISLHYGLTHAGYTIDFVDEKDLEQGALGQRKYSALYLTGPNVTLKAQQMLASWVREGGTVAVLPGAGVADELNTPTTALDEMLGVTGRSAVRDVAKLWEPPHPSGDSLVLSGPAGRGEMPLIGPLTKLQPTTATTLAKVASGEAVITSHVYGKGRALAYSFFPGVQYWLTAERGSLKNLPRNWGATQRAVVVEAARLAKTPRPVEVGTPGVEACLLRSEKGIAVVLLNWTDEPIENLTVSLADVGKHRKVSSVAGGVLKGSVTRNSMKISLPLNNVDVLMVE